MGDRNFTGHLSITTNNVVTATIPNERHLFDEPYITSNGRIKVDRRFENVPIVSYLDPKNCTVPRTGSTFLSSVYPITNYDKARLTITPIQRKSPTPALMGIDTVNSCAGFVNSSSDMAIVF